MGDFDVEIKVKSMSCLEATSIRSYSILIYKIIQFGRSQAQPDKVTVIGAATKVEECIDHLLNLEEEILQEIAERSEESRQRPQRVDPFEVKNSKKKGGNVSPRFFKISCSQVNH